MSKQIDYQDIKNHVCSLEISKELERLGIQQKSYFYWKESFPKPSRHWVYAKKDMDDFGAWKKMGYLWSAFTSLELGHMLPEAIEFRDKWYFYCQTKNAQKGCHLKYTNDSGDILSESIGTEINTRASILISLIKNGYIKASEQQKYVESEIL
jgi:hypothetical protein